MLQQGKSSAIAHTCNDGEDEGEAEEEERMVMKLSPVESAQAIVIGAGSEPVGLKYRHHGFLSIEGKIKSSRPVKVPLQVYLTIASLRLGVLAL